MEQSSAAFNVVGSPTYHLRDSETAARKDRDTLSSSGGLMFMFGENVEQFLIFAGRARRFIRSVRPSEPRDLTRLEEGLRPSFKLIKVAVYFLFVINKSALWL